MLALALALSVYAMLELGVNTNENDLFSEDVPYQALRRDWNEAFPNLVDPLVVALDGETPELAEQAADRLARALKAMPDTFGRVHRPAGGTFFERHAFLYLEPEELDDQLANLHGIQPYIAELSADPSLRGFAKMLSQAARAGAKGELGDFDLAPIFARVDAVLGDQLSGFATALSFTELISGETPTRRGRRRFLLVTPIVDFASLQPAERSLLTLRESSAEVERFFDKRIRIRTTGVFALSYEEMEHLDVQSFSAGAFSFVAVGTLLFLGLGSARLVAAALVTLLAGLGSTAGFAVIGVGHLNLISVAFAVLFIGLSIDFAIHLCVRFRELLHQGQTRDAALVNAASDVGPSLCLCAFTTAIGFFAFAPTEYAGVAELGVIAGTGMFISLVMNLTLLPALICAWVSGDSVTPQAALSTRLRKTLAFPIDHARAILLSTALLAAFSVWLLPGAHFDPNPLRVRDPSAPSVQVFEEMLADGDAMLWTLNVLAPDLETAERIAEQLEALSTVESTTTLMDFVPDSQAEKLASIEEAAFVLLPSLSGNSHASSPSLRAQQQALAELIASLGALIAVDPLPERQQAAESLARSVEELRQQIGTSQSNENPLLERIESALIGDLPASLDTIRRALEPGPVGLEDLPREIREHNIAVDGRARVEILPAEDLGDPALLANYVRSVQRIAPDSFGEALVILETGDIVVRALQQALVTAAVLIGGLLLLLWRNGRDAALVALPLALAALLTTAAAVALSLPFNFANVIVIPLLLGMGVDTGIHLVHRLRTDVAPRTSLLQTSTARAVLLSALTTIASFGTLGLSSHLGMASLGQLLALGITVMLLCNLTVLPALAHSLPRGQT